MGSPNPTTYNPSQYVIMQDNLIGDSTVTASSEAGSFVKTAVPASTNEGDLAPFQNQRMATGTELVDLDYYLFKSGGLLDNAEWGWKKNSESSASYRGIDDVRLIQNTAVPWGAMGAGYGHAIGVSRKYNRLLLFKELASHTAGSGTVFDLAYRDFDASPYTWTTTTVIADNFDNNFSTGDELVAACVELPDGAMRLFVKTGSGSATDITMLGSSDGGVTWAILVRNLFETYAGSTAQAFEWFEAKVSGDWIRIVVIDTQGTDSVRTLISGDRGSTWKELDAIQSPAASRATGNDSQKYALALEGTGMADGSFYMAFLKDDTTDTWVRYTAHIDSAWISKDLAGTDVGYSPIRATTFNDGSYIYEILIRQVSSSLGSSGNSQLAINMIQYSVKDIASGNIIALTNTSKGVFDFDYNARYEPAYLRCAMAGPSVVLLTGLTDPLGSTIGETEDYSFVQYLFGWTKQSIRINDPGTLPYPPPAGVTFGQTIATAWQSAYGQPTPSSTNGPGSSGDFSQTLSGTQPLSWSPSGLKINGASALATVGRIYWTKPLGLANSLLEQGIVFFRVRVTAWAGSTLSAANLPYVGAKIVAQDGSGNYASLSIGLNQGGNIDVYDNNASSVVANLTGINYTAASDASGEGYADVRLAFIKVSGSYYVSLYVGSNSGSDPTFSSDTVNTLTLAAGTPTEEISFGHMVTSVGTETRVSFWKGIYWKDLSMGIEDFSNPTDCRGPLASPYERYVYNGVYVRWGGGAGFNNDSWDADVGYANPKEAVKVASPNVTWRSQNITSDQHITFQADPNDVKQFTVDGIAFFNTNCRYLMVEFAISSGTLSAAPNGATMSVVDCAIKTGLTIVTGSIRSDGFSVTDGTTPYIFRDGQLKNHIAHVTSSTLTDSAGDPYVYSFRIASNYGGRIHLEGITTTGGITALSIANGDAVVIISPFGAMSITTYPTITTNTKYMRVWFPKDVTSGYKNRTPMGEDYFQLGAMVAGPMVGFSIPMEWDSTETNQSNIQEKLLPNGMKVAYKLGPPRRGFTGRIVGDVLKTYASSSGSLVGKVSFRRMFRDMVNVFADYSGKPMCLILNIACINTGGSGSHGLVAADHVMYCRFAGELTMADQAWITGAYGSDRNYRAGDMAISFEEEV